MFGVLTEKLQGVFSRLGGKGRLTEENVSEGVREVRMALLEADVNFGVTKAFVKRVKEKSLGQEVVKSVAPGQQFIKVIHDELADLMGEDEVILNFDGAPCVILMCGLQGSGKTTTCIKLAKYLGKNHAKEKVLVAACDLQRPAAVDQLEALGRQAGVSVFSLPGETNPVRVVKQALTRAKDDQYEVLILDTAGRLHIDEPLMKELAEVKRVAKPRHTFFVANATTGQDAVNSAAAIDKAVGIDGSILTMLDGDTRGGAAISVREVTGKPLLFEGVGERVDDLQLFNPISMADRILGMGDTINLVKRAQDHMSEEEAERLEKKMRKATFTYSDYLSQFKMIEKMGPLKGLLKMLPLPIDAGALEGMEGEFTRMKAIIQSMTLAERNGSDDLEVSRRRRIAAGSGTSIGDVNKLVKSFRQSKQLFKKAGNRKALGKKMANITGGGTPWQ